jgi:endonuclease G
MLDEFFLKMHKKPTLRVYLIIVCSLFANYLGATSVSDSLLPSNHKGYTIAHNYYTISYSEADKQAEWAAYYLTPASISGTQKRASKFMPDPLLQAPVKPSAYIKTGYDRGHLCPAADMKLNGASMTESFYMSNMSPQVPSFNRGIWSKLEDKVREWALEKNGVYVVTGPLLNKSCGTIADAITVPCSFYKIIFKQTPHGAEAIAFILSNAGSSLPLKQFVVTIDYLESLTGIDFFASLSDTEEEKFESVVLTNNWQWN